MLGDAGNCQAAHVRHDVPVAVTRRAHGECLLTHKDDAPGKRRKVKPRPRREKSVIETARELRRTLDSGKAKTQAQLARKIGITRARVTQLLNLLRVSPQIQNYLVKTKDENGRISERRLRPLLRIPSRKEQIQRFRCMLAQARS